MSLSITLPTLPGFPTPSPTISPPPKPSSETITLPAESTTEPPPAPPSTSSTTTTPPPPPPTSSTTTKAEDPSSTSSQPPPPTSKPADSSTTSSTQPVPPSSTNDPNPSHSSTSATPSVSTTSTSGTSAGASASVTPSGSVTYSSVLVSTRTNAAGQMETLTYTSVVTKAATATSSLPSATHTATPFLKNTAAVAGTFTAVGLVALVIIALCATRAVRRRRARAFDSEVEAAAAEAAKATDGALGIDDDDDDDYRARSHRTGYSDATHGTHGAYAQPAMPVESYNMRELGPGGYVGVGGGVPGVAYGSDGYKPSAAHNADSYGSGGTGTTYSNGDGYATGGTYHDLDPAHMGNNPVQPYNAFAGPPHEPHAPYMDYTSGAGDPYGATTAVYPPHAEFDSHRPAGPGLLDAAGLSTGVVAEPTSPLSATSSRRSAALVAQERGVPISRSPSQVPTVHHGADLHRNKSITLEQGFFDPAAPPLPEAPPGLTRDIHDDGLYGQQSYADRYAPLPEGSAPRLRERAPGLSPSRPSSMLDPSANPSPPAPPAESYASAYVNTGMAQRHSRGWDSDSDGEEMPMPRRPTHDSQASFRDDVDYGYNSGARVLRVANE